MAVLPGSGRARIASMSIRAIAWSTSSPARNEENPAVSRDSYHEVRAQTTVSACLLDYLELEGVTRLFGIPARGS